MKKNISSHRLVLQQYYLKRLRSLQIFNVIDRLFMAWQRLYSSRRHIRNLLLFIINVHLTLRKVAHYLCLGSRNLLCTKFGPKRITPSKCISKKAFNSDRNLVEIGRWNPFYCKIYIQKFTPDGRTDIKFLTCDFPSSKNGMAAN